MSSLLSLNRSSCCIQVLQNTLANLRIAGPTFQIRGKNHLNRQHPRNPIWFVRKERKLHEDYIVPENKNFIKEVIHDKFGPPAFIKGVQTYNTPNDSILKLEELKSKQDEWKPSVRRCGVIARKIGQYPLWTKNGTKIRTTLLQIVDNQVVKYIPPEEYDPAQKRRIQPIQKWGCLLVGAESTDPSLLTKEYYGLFKDSGVMPKKKIGRFIVSPSAALPPGTPLDVTHFRVGEFVDVRGKTVDHGFQGVIKRHGFKGMPASHGVTKTHRRGGNIGGGGEKGRVWPGTKMPGHMGNRYRIAKGLRIWRINTKYNVMWVQGSAIPGETHGYVYIYDTILPLRKPKTPLPFPTYISEEKELPADIWCEDIHDFSEPTIYFKPE